MTSHLERLALQQRLRVGPQRRVILRIIDQAHGPLSAADIHLRAYSGPEGISLSTVQRTLKQLTAAGLLRRTVPKGRKARYEKIHRRRRESLLNTTTGERLEFHSEGIEGLLKYAVNQLGYRLLDYHLELYGLPDIKAGPRTDQGADPRATESPAHTPRDTTRGGRRPRRHKDR